MTVLVTLWVGDCSLCLVGEAGVLLNTLQCPRQQGMTCPEISVVLSLRNLGLKGPQVFFRKVNSRYYLL